MKLKSQRQTWRERTYIEFRFLNSAYRKYDKQYLLIIYGHCKYLAGYDDNEIGLKVYSSKHKPLIKPLFLIYVLSWLTIPISWILWGIIEGFILIFSAPAAAYGNQDDIGYSRTIVSLILWMILSGLGIWKFIEIL